MSAKKIEYSAKVQSMSTDGKVREMIKEIRAMHRSVSRIHDLLIGLIADCDLMGNRNTNPLTAGIQGIYAIFTPEAETPTAIVRWIKAIGFRVGKTGNVTLDKNVEYSVDWFNNVKRGPTWYQKMASDAFKPLPDQIPASSLGSYLAKLESIGGEMSDEEIVKAVRQSAKSLKDKEKTIEWVDKYFNKVEAGEIEPVVSIDEMVAKGLIEVQEKAAPLH